MTRLLLAVPALVFAGLGLLLFTLFLAFDLFIDLIHLFYGA